MKKKDRRDLRLGVPLLESGQSNNVPQEFPSCSSCTDTPGNKDKRLCMGKIDNAFSLSLRLR